MKKIMMALVASTMLVSFSAPTFAAFNPANIDESSHSANIYKVIDKKIAKGKTSGVHGMFAWAEVEGEVYSVALSELRKYANPGKRFSEIVGEQVMLANIETAKEEVAAMKKAIVKAVFSGVSAEELEVANEVVRGIQMQIDLAEAVNADDLAEQARIRGDIEAAESDLADASEALAARQQAVTDLLATQNAYTEAMNALPGANTEAGDAATRLSNARNALTIAMNRADGFITDFSAANLESVINDANALVTATTTTTGDSPEVYTAPDLGADEAFYYIQYANPEHPLNPSRNAGVELTHFGDEVTAGGSLSSVEGRTIDLVVTIPDVLPEGVTTVRQWVSDQYIAFRANRGDAGWSFQAANPGVTTYSLSFNSDAANALPNISGRHLADALAGYTARETGVHSLNRNLERDTYTAANSVVVTGVTPVTGAYYAYSQGGYVWGNGTWTYQVFSEADATGPRLGMLTAATDRTVAIRQFLTDVATYTPEQLAARTVSWGSLSRTDFTVGLSVADIRAINDAVETAFNDGYNDGYVAGFGDGYEDGFGAGVNAAENSN